MRDPFVYIKPDFIYMPPFQPLLFGDFKAPENFPNCCTVHEKMIEETRKLVDRFPNCCDFHRTMAKNPLVNVADYKTEDFARSIVMKILYTEHHIAERIEQSNWYKDITDYIEYVQMSLGMPSFGDHIYKWGVTSMIGIRQNEIGLNKAQQLLDYVNGLYDKLPDEPVAEEIDVNELYHIYQKWLSIFPFTVKPFDKLKDRFTNIFPLYSEEPVYNSYTGLFKAKVVTKAKLIEWLIEKTKETLKLVKFTELIPEGFIKDINTHRLSIINEQHKARQTALLQEFSKSENQYVQIITKWLNNEEKYYKSITPLLATKQIGVASAVSNADDRINTFNPPMKLDEIRSWFIQLAENNSKNGERFLLAEQVEQFIERAFVGVPFVEKLSINAGKGDRGKVVGLFHAFYTYCTTHQSKTGKIDKNATADKYIRLLTDHFTGWTFEEVKNNFRSGGNWKKPAC